MLLLFYCVFKVDQKFKKTQTVEALRGDVYRMAVIVGVHVNGTYDVIFGDRVKETNVPENNMREVNEAGLSNTLQGGSPQRPSKEDQATPRPTEKTEPTLPTQATGIAPSVSKHPASIPAEAALVPKEDTDREAHAQLQDGMLVEARYGGGMMWYEGKVRKAHKDGTFDIDYDDGESEVQVQAELVRPRPVRSPVKPNRKLHMGAGVIANNHGQGTWFSGHIAKVRVNGTFDVDYDDGEKEFGMSSNAVVLLSPYLSLSILPELDLQVGSRVVGNYRGKNVWYPGVIRSISADASKFSVDFDDGEKEDGLDATQIRHLPPDNASSEATVPSQSATAGSKVAMSTLVSTEASTDFQQSSSSASPLKKKISKKGLHLAEVQVGDIIQARHHQKWIPVRMEARNADGSFDVTPMIGKNPKLHHNIPANHLRQKEPVEEGATTTPVDSSSIAKPTCMNPTTSAAVAGAETSEKVQGIRRPSAAFIKQSGDGFDEADNVFLVTGANVEVNKGGKGEWFPAVIKNDYAGVGFHYLVEVTLPDGSKATSKVKRKFLRYNKNSQNTAVAARESNNSNGNGSTLAKAASFSGELEGEGFIQGALVLANYRGRGKWYPGHIAAICDGGNFDIDYDDGEQESAVAVQHLKLRDPEEPPLHYQPIVATVAPSATTTAFRVGMGVECNYLGKGRWYPGRIVVANRDLTFDVTFVDGTSEDSVEPERLRLPGSAVPPATPAPAIVAPLQEGDKVEGNYRGKGTWYPGVVDRVRQDGSIDIDYDDGEREVRVAREYTRPPRSAVTTSAPISVQLVEGLKVEGNYRGKGRWYSARIDRVRADGTYDLDYDDGESESRIVADRIRVVTTASTSVQELQPQHQQKPNKPGSSFATPSKGGRTYRVAMGIDMPAVMTKEDLGSPLALISPKASNGNGSAMSPRKVPVSVVGVEANYRNKGIWLPVKLVTDRGNGLVDVVYADGGIEEGISADRLRSSLTAAVDAVQKLLQVENVEVNYHNKGVWLPAKLVHRNTDGTTADVVYEDGEEEHGVDVALIRSHALPSADEAQPLKPNSSEVKAFKVGDHVVANYRDLGSWLPGVIEKARPDGTYDVLHDDGELEFRVPPTLIKAQPPLPQRPAQMVQAPPAGSPVVGAGRPARPYSAGATRSHRIVNGTAKASASSSSSSDAAHTTYISDQAEEAGDGSMLVTRAELNALKSLLEKKDEDIRSLAAGSLGSPTGKVGGNSNGGRTPQNSVRWGDEVDSFGTLEEVEPLTTKPHRILLAAKDAEIATLTSEVQNLEETNAVLREGMQKMKTRYAALNQELEVLRLREERMVRQLDAQNLQISKLLR